MKASLRARTSVLDLQNESLSKTDAKTQLFHKVFHMMWKLWILAVE